MSVRRYAWNPYNNSNEHSSAVPILPDGSIDRHSNYSGSGTSDTATNFTMSGDTTPGYQPATAPATNAAQRAIAASLSPGTQIIAALPQPGLLHPHSRQPCPPHVNPHIDGWQAPPCFPVQIPVQRQLSVPSGPMAAAMQQAPGSAAETALRGKTPALSKIQELRSYTRDMKVDIAVPQLPVDLQLSMLQHILMDDPSLFFDLCTSFRGNILAQLLRCLVAREAVAASALGATCLGRVVHLLKSRWIDLVCGQTSSVAVGRLLCLLPVEHQCDIVKYAVQPHQQPLADAPFSATAGWVGPKDLAQHQFGNFVLKEVMTIAAQHLDLLSPIFAQLAAEFCDPNVFTLLAESRSGSHVLETFLRVAPPECNTRLCSLMFSTTEGLDAATRMAWSRQGYYPLQTALLVLRQQRSPIFSKVKASLNWMVDGSPHAAKLLNAAGLVKA